MESSDWFLEGSSQVEGCVFLSSISSGPHTAASWEAWDMNSKVGHKSILLLIDPQRDFHAGGRLTVPCADADSERIAEMILSI